MNASVTWQKNLRELAMAIVGRFQVEIVGSVTDKPIEKKNW